MNPVFEEIVMVCENEPTGDGITMVSLFYRIERLIKSRAYFTEIPGQKTE
jgi:hypothetical protein